MSLGLVAFIVWISSPVWLPVLGFVADWFERRHDRKRPLAEVIEFPRNVERDHAHFLPGHRMPS